MQIILTTMRDEYSSLHLLVTWEVNKQYTCDIILDNLRAAWYDLATFFTFPGRVLKITASICPVDLLSG